MQIINVVGVQDFMDGKIDDNEMKSWEWHPYMTRRFPEHFPAKKLFTDDFDEIFSGLAAKAEPDTLFNGQLR